MCHFFPFSTRCHFYISIFSCHNILSSARKSTCHSYVIVAKINLCDTNMMEKRLNPVQAGRDVVACLNEAMERQGLDMRVSALV